MSTSKQVQQSVSQAKLEQAAGKIDQAKDVIMKEIQNLVDMEKSLTATENAGPTGKKIAETKKALEEKLAELNSLAIKMMDSVDDTITIFETLTGLYDEFDVKKLAKMPVSSPKADINKLIRMDPKYFTCPWFILRKIALEDQINALYGIHSLLPGMTTDIMNKNAKEAKNLMRCHNENMLKEERVAELHARVLLSKEKLRLFSQIVETRKHEKVGTPVFDEIRLQNVVDNFRSVNRDQRPIHFFVKARLRFYERDPTAVRQTAFYAAIDEMAAEEEVVAEIARYFLAHCDDKVSMLMAEKDFPYSVSNRINNIMIAQFNEYCEMFKTAAAAGQGSDDLKEKVSWVQTVLHTVPYRRNNLPYIDGMFVKYRTDHHLQIVNKFDKSAKSDTTVTPATTATSDKKDTSVSAAASDKAGTSDTTTTTATSDKEDTNVSAAASDKAGTSDTPTTSDTSATSDTPTTSDTTVPTGKTTPSHQMILYYEFLSKNLFKSPFFDQQFTMLEDCSKKLPKEQFEELELKFFQCIFPAIAFFYKH